MPSYMVERLLPQMSAEEWKELTRKISEAADQIPELTWIKSHASETDHKCFCYFESPNADLLYEHARRANVPIDYVHLLDRSLNHHEANPQTPMRRFIVERTIPKFSDEQWKAIQEQVGKAADEMPGVNWIKCSVSESSGKAYCEFEAPNPEVLREHSRRVNLPVDRIATVDLEFDPTMFR